MPSTSKASSPPSRRRGRAKAGGVASTSLKKSKHHLKWCALFRILPCVSSYFYQSSSGSEEGEEGEGETEESIRQKIAKEFRYNEGEKGEGHEEGGKEEEDDPLEAFMAGIEVGII